MIDALRLFMHRPLRDRDRTRLFMLAVLVMGAAAAAFALLDRPEPARAPAAHPPPTVRPARTPAAAPAATATPVARERPSEEGHPPAPVARPRVQAAKRAARRFLAGYLPYSYGQRRARRIRAATPALKRRLARERPRVPPRERARRARVMLVQAAGVGARRAGIVALVADGARSYSVALELVRARAGWRVTRVGS
jgi:hypothetical protein